MRCDELSQAVWLGPEGEAERRALEAHMRECDRCAARLKRARQVDAALRSAVLLEPPAELSARLLALPERAPAASGAVARVDLAEESAAAGASRMLRMAPYVLVALLTALATLSVRVHFEVGDPVAAIDVLLSMPTGELLGWAFEQAASWLVWLALLPLAWALRPDQSTVIGPGGAGER